MRLGLVKTNDAIAVVQDIDFQRLVPVRLAQREAGFDQLVNVIDIVLCAAVRVEKDNAPGPGFADRAPFAEAPDVIDERIEILITACAVRINLPRSHHFLQAVAVDVGDNRAGHL